MIHIIDLQGNKTPYLEAKMYRDIQVSPNGEYVLVSFVKPPFSYLVPSYRFPTETHVYDLNANRIKVISDIPLQEVLPKGFMAVSTEKRNISWRKDQGSTIYFVKALDNGDPEVKADFRDALYQWESPFKSDPKQLTKIKNRFSSVIWGNESLAIIFDRWWNNRNTKTYGPLIQI